MRIAVRQAHLPRIQILNNAINYYDKSSHRATNLDRTTPKKDTINPPIMAVINPFSGLTPDAIPNAIANGNATIPTIVPDIKSLKNFSLEYDCTD